MAERPNFLARTVAAIRLSVRYKLLISYLGITLLLVGLALFGLNTLQQANARTEALIHDQERINFFNEAKDTVQEAMAMTLALTEPISGTSNTTGGWFTQPGLDLVQLISEIAGHLGRGQRKFGKPGMPDASAIERLRQDAIELKLIADQANKLRKQGDVAGSARFGREQVFDRLRSIQRGLYTVVRGIEDEMATRARITAQAYLASQQNILAAGLSAVGVAMLLGYSLSSSLLWPIGRIRQALGRIADGGFDTRVTVPNRDELGELARHVNDTSAQLGALYDEVEAQKAQLAEWNTALEGKVANQVDEIERVNRLRRFLPPQVAKLIVEAPDATDALATRRAEITVLFADLRGFSAYANMSAPDDVVGVLNAFHSACGPLIEEQGGTLERFLGDGLMVLFGAPLPQDDAAARAMALATAMQGAVRDAIAPFRSDDAPLGLGIGIGTGPATLGQIGFEGRQDYSAIGPAPNLAARLCDKAGDGQILLSHATVWQIQAKVRPAGTFDLKGIGDNIAAFELETSAENL